MGTGGIPKGVIQGIRRYYGIWFETQLWHPQGDGEWVGENTEMSGKLQKSW